MEENEEQNSMPLTKLVHRGCTAAELLKAFKDGGLHRSGWIPIDSTVLPHESNTPSSRYTRDRDCALSAAVLAGNVEIVRALVERMGANVVACCPVKGLGTAYVRIEPPLVTAVRMCKLDVVRELLRLGADVNQFASDCHMNPIHFACNKGDVVILRELVENGADIESRADYNFTPLQEALISKHQDCLEYLLWQGCDLSTHTSLQEDAYKDTDLEVDPEEEDSPGETALTLAFILGLVDSIQILIQAGSDVRLMPEVEDAFSVYLANEDPLWMFRMLLLAGTSVTPSYLLTLPALEHRHPHCTQWLRAFRKQPLSLLQLSRLVIRRRIRDCVQNRAILRYTDRLSVPKAIREYLWMKVV